MNTDAIKAAICNRKRLQKLLKGYIFGLQGRDDVVRNNDVNYAFRQSSEFIHLTGYHEPGAILLMTEKESFFFIKRVSQQHLVWLGSAETPASAKSKFGFDQVYYIDEFEKVVRRICSSSKTIVANLELRPKFKNVSALFQFDSNPIKEWLPELRSVKTKEELKLMQYVAKVSSEAHIEVMTKTKVGMREYQVQSIFENALKFRHVLEQSYPAIVARGKNAAVLHYVHNRDKLLKGDLLLIDAGGEYCGYAADITRTFPVNGSFTKKQQEIYEIVLNAQKQCLKMIKPGVWLSELQDKAIEILTEGLRNLKLLEGSLNDLIVEKAYAPFYPHGVSHMLGLDVHDVTPKLKTRKKSSMRSQMLLNPGHVITVEPGLYFIEALLNDKDIRKKYKKMIRWNKVEAYLEFGGVRIEDDVVVKSKGSRVLTSVPKEVKDIEAMMKRA